MPVENPFAAFSEWFPSAALMWLIVVGVLAAVGLLAGWLIATFRNGPIAGVRITLEVLAGMVGDLLLISPRRVWALAWLAIKEAVRRRIVVGFAVFLVLLLFAGWFLDMTSSDPARLYLVFVLSTTTYLVLLLALFLSAFSLPADLKSKTLHTVVTKPVRASEIVLGRMVGFTVIGTALLVAMSVISYVFVVRGLDHRHELAAEDFTAADPQAQPPATTGGKAKKPALAERLTETSQGHRHRFRVDGEGRPVGINADGKQVSVDTAGAPVMVEADGRRVPADPAADTGLWLDDERGHSHELRVRSAGGKLVYDVGAPEGMLQARVPVYGKLRFQDRAGTDTEKGISVGDEWTYRSFIQGASDAAAIWTFKGITAKRFPEGLPVEMNIGVFRTYKGDIEKGVLGNLLVRNPKTGLTVEAKVFESKEFVVKQLFVPREIVNPSRAMMVARKIETQNGVEQEPADMDSRLANRKQFDLFDDLVADGEVEIWLKCAEPSQYFGAGQSDLYLRAADVPFAFNFFKGYFGIWLQMVIIIGFGVMFSTFLSGPVAMLATAGALLGGMFSEFMFKLATGQLPGGGPFESFIRLLTQENVVSDLAPSLQTTVARMADSVAKIGLWVISSILPPFDRFSYADQVAYGYDITWDPLIVNPTLMALGYLIPVFIAAYLFLKTREVAR